MNKTDKLLNKYNIKPYCLGGVGNGWLNLVEELIIKLIDLGWDRNLAQIKEKFGGLRFYVGSATDEMHDLISEYEKKSYFICEDCGKPGKLRDERNWILTLCDKCDKR